MTTPSVPTAPTVDPLLSFTGWIRQGRGRWRLFCRAASEQAALDELLQRAPRGCDKQVRQGNGDPNDDRRPRR